MLHQQGRIWTERICPSVPVETDDSDDRDERDRISFLFDTLGAESSRADRPRSATTETHRLERLVPSISAASRVRPSSLASSPCGSASRRTCAEKTRDRHARQDGSPPHRLHPKQLPDHCVDMVAQAHVAPKDAVIKLLFAPALHGRFALPIQAA